MSDAKATSAVRRPRFLILEDEAQLITLYEMGIRDWFRDPEIISFTGGNAAWEELNRREPDLLLMDCSHPGMNGVEILEKLAARKAECRVLLTSDLFMEELARFQDSQLKIFYLPKPFGIVQFWRMLNEIIGPSDFPERQAMIGGGDIAPA
jgi:CheY-like chemotaxis protein